MSLMSVIRFLSGVSVIIVAGLVTPFALAPGLNSADVLWLASAPVLVALWWPRSKTPTGGDASPSSEASPSAVLPVGSSSHPLAEVDGDLAAHEARMEARARRLAGDS